MANIIDHNDMTLEQVTLLYGHFLLGERRQLNSKSCFQKIPDNVNLVITA